MRRRVGPKHRPVQHHSHSLTTDGGKVQLQLGITPQGEYAKANHSDERGVVHHINWELSLDIPKSERLPSLNDIAENVHSDLKMLTTLMLAGQLNLGVKDVDGTPASQFGSPDDVSPEQFAQATREHWLWWERGDVDFQLKSGGVSGGYEIGATGMKPAVIVDYYSVVDDTTLARTTCSKCGRDSVSSTFFDGE